MSTAATYWALSQGAISPLAKHLLMILADVADWQHQTTANLDYMARFSEMPIRSIHHHLKELQAEGLITPIFGPIDAYGLAPLIGYRLAMDDRRVVPTAQPRKSRLRSNLAQGDAKEGLSGTTEPGIAAAAPETYVAPPLIAAPGSRSWWAIFWQRVLSSEPTAYMVAEAEQGRGWPVAGPLPTDDQEAALVELGADNAAAWEVWLSGNDARFPIHDLPENPGLVFAPHAWPRELV